MTTSDPVGERSSADYRALYEAEREKFQAETLKVSRILDVLDHWRYIADQPDWDRDPHQVLWDCIAEARAAANHLSPKGPGHAGSDCPWQRTEPERMRF